MLSREDIQALILLRLQAADESCNSYHINHVAGQVRALCAVLNDGVVPGANDDASVILDAAGIPYREADNMLDFDPDWLKERGFTVTDDDKLRHDKLDKLRF